MLKVTVCKSKSVSPNRCT